MGRKTHIENREPVTFLKGGAGALEAYQVPVPGTMAEQAVQGAMAGRPLQPEPYIPPPHYIWH